MAYRFFAGLELIGQMLCTYLMQIHLYGYCGLPMENESSIRISFGVSDLT